MSLFLSVHQVYDLLQPQGKCLPLREDKDRGVVEIAGVAEKAVSSPGAVLELLQFGNRHRKTEATMANQVSSRSHAVLQLVVRHVKLTPAGRESMVESKLSLIDLAGSERASATNNTGARLNEGANINKSLLALANCINALSENSSSLRQSNVKFRDSKLTHLLRSSLEGNCSLVMIANINPSHKTYEDSHNTLKYANRAKNIKVDPTVTDKVKDSTWVEREARLREENDALKNQVALLQQMISKFSGGAGSAGVSASMPELQTLQQLLTGAPASAPSAAKTIDEAEDAFSMHSQRLPAPRTKSGASARPAAGGLGDLRIDLKSGKFMQSTLQMPRRVQQQAGAGDVSVFDVGNGFEIENAADEPHELLLDSSSNITFSGTEFVSNGRTALKRAVVPRVQIYAEVEPVPPTSAASVGTHSSRKRRREAGHQVVAPLSEPDAVSVRLQAHPAVSTAERNETEMPYADQLQLPKDSSSAPVNKKRRGSFIPVKGNSAVGVETADQMDIESVGPETATDESFAVGNTLVELCAAKEPTKTLLGQASSHFMRNNSVKVLPKQLSFDDENKQVSSMFGKSLLKSRRSLAPTGEVDKKYDILSASKMKKAAPSTRAALGPVLNNKITAAFNQLRSSNDEQRQV